MVAEVARRAPPRRRPAPWSPQIPGDPHERLGPRRASARARFSAASSQDRLEQADRGSRIANWVVCTPTARPPAPAGQRSSGVSARWRRSSSLPSASSASGCAGITTPSRSAAPTSTGRAGASEIARLAPRSGSACRGFRRLRAPNRRSTRSACAVGTRGSRTARSRRAALLSSASAASVPVNVARHSEQLAEPVRDQRDATRLGAGDVERRTAAPRQCSNSRERDGVGVALPDHVDVAHREVDRLAARAQHGRCRASTP